MKLIIKQAAMAHPFGLGAMQLTNSKKAPGLGRFGANILSVELAVDNYTITFRDGTTLIIACTPLDVSTSLTRTYEHGARSPIDELRVLDPVSTLDMAVVEWPGFSVPSGGSRYAALLDSKNSRGITPSSFIKIEGCAARYFNFGQGDVNVMHLPSGGRLLSTVSASALEQDTLSTGAMISGSGYKGSKMLNYDIYVNFPYVKSKAQGADGKISWFDYGLASLTEILFLRFMSDLRADTKDPILLEAVSDALLAWDSLSPNNSLLSVLLTLWSESGFGQRLFRMVTNPLGYSGPFQFSPVLQKQIVEGKFFADNALGSLGTQPVISKLKSLVLSPRYFRRPLEDDSAYAVAYGLFYILRGVNSYERRKLNPGFISNRAAIYTPEMVTKPNWRWTDDLFQKDRSKTLFEEFGIPRYILLDGRVRDASCALYLEDTDRSAEDIQNKELSPLLYYFAIYRGMSYWSYGFASNSAQAGINGDNNSSASDDDNPDGFTVGFANTIR